MLNSSIWHICAFWVIRVVWLDGCDWVIRVVWLDGCDWVIRVVWLDGCGWVTRVVWLDGCGSDIMNEPTTSYIPCTCTWREYISYISCNMVSVRSEKPITRPTPSLGSFPNIAFETGPVFDIRDGPLSPSVLSCL